MHATRSGPNSASSASVGGTPSGGTSPFARDTIPAPLATPCRSSSASASARPFDGTARNTQVRAMELVLATAERSHLQLSRQRDAGQVALVLAALGQLLRLLGGPAQERRAHAGAHEEQRHGCTE